MVLPECPAACSQSETWRFRFHFPKTLLASHLPLIRIWWHEMFGKQNTSGTHIPLVEQSQGSKWLRVPPPLHLETSSRWSRNWNPGLVSWPAFGSWCKSQQELAEDTGVQQGSSTGPRSFAEGVLLPASEVKCPFSNLHTKWILVTGFYWETDSLTHLPASTSSTENRLSSLL